MIARHYVGSSLQKGRLDGVGSMTSKGVDIGRMI